MQAHSYAYQSTSSRGEGAIAEEDGEGEEGEGDEEEWLGEEEARHMVGIFQIVKALSPCSSKSIDNLICAV